MEDHVPSSVVPKKPFFSRDPDLENTEEQLEDAAKNAAVMQTSMLMTASLVNKTLFR